MLSDGIINDISSDVRGVMGLAIAVGACLAGQNSVLSSYIGSGGEKLRCWFHLEMAVIRRHAPSATDSRQFGISISRESARTGETRYVMWAVMPIIILLETQSLRFSSHLVGSSSWGGWTAHEQIQRYSTI